MPYPNEHACRLKSPDDFQADSFRRTSRDSDGKRYDVIMGKLKGEDTMTEQAYRYPKGSWSASSARSHCNSHDGIAFEPAAESDSLPANYERRIINMTDWEVREAADEQPAEIAGYAAVYDSLSEDLGGFREIIRPGFFTGVLDDDVRGLFNHDANYVLGRSTAGTLQLADDKRGLGIRLQPPDTQWARDLMVSMKRGDITQMSFGFFVKKPDGDAWRKDQDGNVIRELLTAERLLDVSVVTYPAYPQTSAEARSHLSELTGADDQAVDEPDGNEAGTRQALAAAQRTLEIKRRK